MYLICNAGTGEDRGGYTVLIKRGKVMNINRFTAAEKAAWSTNVPFLFQQKYMGGHGDNGKNCTGICGVCESQA